MPEPMIEMMLQTLPDPIQLEHHYSSHQIPLLVIQKPRAKMTRLSLIQEPILSCLQRAPIQTPDWMRQPDYSGPFLVFRLQPATMI